MEGVLIIIILIFLHGVVLSQAQGQLYDESKRDMTSSFIVSLNNA
jgi:hypothetical protein